MPDKSRFNADGVSNSWPFGVLTGLSFLKIEVRDGSGKCAQPRPLRIDAAIATGINDHTSTDLATTRKPRTMKLLASLESAAINLR